MKRLVQTLLMALPRMGYLVSLILFIMLVFSILGVQLFTRKLYQRCRFSDVPIFDETLVQWTWPIDWS